MKDLVQSRKCEETPTGREDVAETRLLRDHGPAGRQVLRAALAEPAAAEAHVLVFGDGELAARPLDVPPVIVEIARDSACRPNLPAVVFQQALVFVAAACQGQLERLARAAWQIEEFQEFVMFAPAVDLAPVFEVSRLFPVTDCRKCLARCLTIRLPEVEEDGRRRGPEVKTLGQWHLAVRLTVVQAPGKKKVMRLEQCAGFRMVIVQ